MSLPFWNSCFLCALTLKEGSGHCYTTRAHKLLLKYLLNDFRLEKPESVRVLQFLETSSKGTPPPAHFKLCSKCNDLAQLVVSLQLQLEQVQMRIIEFVRRGKREVIDNSRLYGTNTGVVLRFLEFEKCVEEKELGGGGSCEEERRFLEVLHQFQVAVFENDGKEVQVPLVYLEKYTGGKMQLLRQRRQTSQNVMVELEKGGGVEPLNEDTGWLSTGYGSEIGNSGTSESDDDDTCDWKGARRPGKRKAVGGSRQNGKIQKVVKTKKVICDICDKKVHPNTIVNHLKIQHEKLYQCPSCDYAFGKFESLARHGNKSHQDLTMKCELCPESESNEYPVKDQILQHLHSSHGVELLLPCRVSPSCTTTFDDELERLAHEKSHQPRTCGICSKSFPNSAKLSKHRRAEHPNEKWDRVRVKLECELCPELKFAKYSQVRHHKAFIHGIGKYIRKRPQCTTCGKKFSAERYLRKHEEAGHDEMNTTTNTYKKYSYMYQRSKNDNYYCTVCKEEFKASDKLSRHYVEVHQFPEYQCELCPSKFKILNLLQSHEKRKHGIGLPAEIFQCSQCPKQFYRLQTLRDHEATHLDSDDFTCEICGFPTKTMKLLRAHVRQAHPPEGDGVNSKACSYCSKVFCTNNARATHERIHTGEKPFGCGCGESFRLKCLLNKHLKKGCPLVKQETAEITYVAYDSEFVT